MFIYSLNDIPKDSNIVLYGKGTRANCLKRFLKLFRNDINVVEQIDTESVEEFVLNAIKYDFILIASVYWQQIVDTVKEYQLDKYKVLSNEMGGLVHEYCKHIDKNAQYGATVKEILSLFKSNEQKELYKLLYNYRIGYESIDKVIQYCIKDINKNKYQYLDYVVKDKISTMIEGGIFDGTFTNLFIKECKNLKNIFGFEPLRDTLKFDYSKLIKTNKIDSLKVSPRGLWDSTTTLNFLYTGGVSSSVAKGNSHNCSIDTTTIDEFVEELKAPKIDFIKMDIEDAELNALKGGINTIKKDRPQMAICIYHSLEQFINIPLYLKNNLESYSYYIEHYNCSQNETVLYAIPKELELN